MATPDDRARAAFDATLAPGPDITLASLTPSRTAVARDHDTLRVVDATHYQLEREIARGGMGRIHLARDRRLGRAVAVKELLVRDGELALRFEREARITARLQHPSIVSVYEAGLWASGFPFYAMPRVNGRSLDEVIDAAATFEQRLALVPNVLAVADAIAYAHGERVIHRDLKPRNVLVGTFGETVVIDWGLAKDLTSAAHEPAAGPYRSAAGSALETSAGEIMGTPAYMPPEQAAGDSVDERADVYAIGAMLHHVLTGKAPYEGRTAVEVLDRVRHEPPAPLRERAPDAAPDLVAIVERAMSRDPARRYPTARELAEDLRRFQTGQLVGAHRYSLGDLVRRWIARHRPALVVGGCAFAVLVVIGILSVRRIVTERERANTQRAAAETNRARADELSDFMLFDMRQKLEPVGKLELLDVVARKAAAYYETRPDIDLGKRATALENIGDVLAAKGDIAAARTTYSRALGLRSTNALAMPGDDATQLALATSFVKLGDVVALQATGTPAARLYESARRLVDAHASTLPWQRQRMQIEQRLAGLDNKRGDVEAARTRLEGALQVATDAARSRPDDTELARDVARIESSLASVYTSSNTESSLTHRRAAITMLETLSARAPADLTLLAALAAENNELGDALEVLGDRSAQLASYRAALAVTERLVAHDPTNPTWKTDLAHAHENIGNALSKTHAVDVALQELHEALAIVDNVFARDPTNVSALARVADVHQDIARAYHDSVFIVHGKDDARDLELAGKALAEYRLAIEVGERVVALDPQNRDAMRNLAVSREELAHTLGLTHDYAGSVAELRHALTAHEQLSALAPDNLWWRADVARVHLDLGSMLRESGDTDGGVAELRLALAIQEELAARDPANVEWHREVVTTHMFTANAYYDRGRDRADALAAVAEYTAALDITRRLAAAAPNDTQTAAAVAFLEHRVELANELLATQRR